MEPRCRPPAVVEVPRRRGAPPPCSPMPTWSPTAVEATATGSGRVPPRPRRISGAHGAAARRRGGEPPAGSSLGSRGGMGGGGRREGGSRHASGHCISCLFVSVRCRLLETGFEGDKRKSKRKRKKLKERCMKMSARCCVKTKKRRSSLSLTLLLLFFFLKRTKSSS